MANSSGPSKSGPQLRQPLESLNVDEALLRMETVQALVGLGRSSIYAKMAQGTFPKAVRRGSRCARWRASEVRGWLLADGREPCPVRTSDASADGSTSKRFR